LKRESPGASSFGQDGRAGTDQLGGESGSSNSNSPSPKQDAAKFASPWSGADRERAVETERLRALLDEAWAYDPQCGTLATRVIPAFEAGAIYAAGRFDLLRPLINWADKLPARCRECEALLNAPDDVGGFSITTAAHAPRLRYAIVSGFCHACAARGHEAMMASAVRGLQRERIAVEILGMKADPA
jgi:hypothetical protein